MLLSCCLHRRWQSSPCPPRPFLGLLVPLSIRFELGYQSSSPRIPDTDVSPASLQASSSGRIGELWRFCSHVAEDSISHKQVALTKRLLNSGRGYSRGSPVCIHKSRRKTNSRSLLKIISEITGEHCVLLWVGVIPETDNPGLPSAGSNAITGLASLWSHCLAHKVGLGTGRTCSSAHRDRFL